MAHQTKVVTCAFGYNLEDPIERRNVMKRAYFIVIVAVVLGLGLAGLTVPSVMANNGQEPKVIAADSVAFGRTYSEWSAAWWQWAFSIPVASHPLFDNGDCNIGQSGPVWFLGGKFCPSGQTCTGSATRSLLGTRRQSTIHPHPQHRRFGSGRAQLGLWQYVSAAPRGLNR
jgi:hypothetical protein